ncbi:MAG: helix-turn-helix domain-containing protein [Parvibaculaceae bacterium]|nr:helix-turn-helix domain-containing protein [Parvibaculaceae bacterium]HBM88043.1 transcriptional regulator [Rhodobiaceae bacterium]|tara:strand:+ start:959 stop:1366 length:408 start_codon:yes stop_codon:yes gene_type:complete
MAQTSAKYRSHCPINFVLETFGDKWTLLIVRDLMFKGKSNFREFLKSDEKIATNILSDRLKRLEEHGIVEKSEDEANRSKLNYRLTEKGKDLMPVMLEITAWSAKHDRLTNTPKPFRKTLAEDREGMISAFLAEL